MVRIKKYISSLPLLLVVLSSIVAIVLLSFEIISETFAIIMILALLSAFILDQAIENFFVKDRFQNLIKTMKKNTELTERIEAELARHKTPCELIDPCRKHIWHFEDEMLWYNPPLVLAEDEIFDIINKNYSNSAFRKAKYLFYNDGSSADKKRYQRRMKRFRTIQKRFKTNNPKVLTKLSARTVKESEPQYSFFVGKKNGSYECIIYLMVKPFAIDAIKGEHPGYVFIIREPELVRRLRNIFNNEWSKGENIKINH